MTGPDPRTDDDLISLAVETIRLLADQAAHGGIDCRRTSALVRSVQATKGLLHDRGWTPAQVDTEMARRLRNPSRPGATR
jgi:hypothetical protein